MLTSHLRARASLVLSERSVTEPALWQLAAQHGVTSFAGVPHTFELLERSGCRDALPATLRYVTQAGGRMAPETVRRWARWGRSAGVDLVVMYGQTEATARMAWLPPALLERCPDAVGVPIPGGELHVEPVAGLDADLPAGTGELVYTGPNVMLGYATEPADLARGADLTRLRTGDLGLRDEDGVFRVVGRLARFAKVYGLRVDLDAAEASLRQGGVTARVLDDDGRLAVFATRPADADRVAELVCDATGLPGHVIGVHLVPELPLTSHGKRDDAPLRRLLAAPAVAHLRRGGPGRRAGAVGVRLDPRAARRHPRRQLRVPARRLAVLRRGQRPAGGAARRRAARLAAAHRAGARCRQRVSLTTRRHSRPHRGCGQRGVGGPGSTRPCCCAPWRSCSSSAATPTSGWSPAAPTPCWRWWASAWCASTSADSRPSRPAPAAAGSWGCCSRSSSLRSW